MPALLVAVPTAAPVDGLAPPPMMMLPLLVVMLAPSSLMAPLNRTGVSFRSRCAVL